MKKNVQKKQKNIKKYLKYTLIALLGLFCLIILYFIERYLFFNLIYYFLKLIIFILSGFNKIKRNLILSLVSFVILIYLHIIIARKIVLSIIFLMGGLFKKFFIYNEYKCLILIQLMFGENIIDYIEKNELEQDNPSINKIKSYIHKVEGFHKVYMDWKAKDEKNLPFEINKFPFEYELGNMLEEFNKLKNNNFLLIDENQKNAILSSIRNYMGKIEVYSQLSSLEIMFKFKAYKSLEFLEDFMLNHFEERQIVKKKITNNFNLYTILPKTKEKDKKLLVIFCNQNALCAESYGILTDNIDVYLKIPETTIIIWNYYGFGLRKGLTTFSKINLDVEILIEFIKKEYKDYKIIIHGVSIGGYSSIKLAKKLSTDRNAILIADRTYGDIEHIVLSLSDIYGKIMQNIYNFLFPKYLYSSDNIKDYISVSKRKKIILFDSNDEIIKYNPSSLVFNLTKKYYEDIVLPKIALLKEYNELINKPKFLTMELQQLSSLPNNSDFSTEGRLFIQHLYKYINKMEEFFIFFIIFGYPFNYYKEISLNENDLYKFYINIPKIMRAIAIRHKGIFSDKLFKLISQYNYLFIKSNLQTDIPDNKILCFEYDTTDERYNELFKYNINSKDNVINYLGYIHRIFCGHNGKLKEKDESFILGFLKKNDFI